MAAACCPRKSPPAASAASSAARSRCGSDPIAAVNASAMAGQTSALRIMFACALKPLAGDVAGLGDAQLAGVRGGAAECIDDADLTDRFLRVGAHEAGEGVLGSTPDPQQLERERAVAALGERLGRDRADRRRRPGHGVAHRERARLDGDAELARVRIARDDRVRHDATALWQRPGNS